MSELPILAVGPASRRLSTKVRIFIEHLEKTFALCSQFQSTARLKLWQDARSSRLILSRLLAANATVTDAAFSRYSSSRQHSTSESPLTQELHNPWARMHFKFYGVLFDARATNSSNLESKSFRMGDWFDFL